MAAATSFSVQPFAPLSSSRYLITPKPRFIFTHTIKSHENEKNNLKIAASATKSNYLCSWYGSWGICFTYATWFAIEGLVATGKTFKNCATIRKAVGFLLKLQLDDGGWGESSLSCPNRGERDPTPLHRGAKLLINSQLENGDFPQQEMSGVFMRSCMLHYPTYRNTFPIWALADYSKFVSLPRTT